MKQKFLPIIALLLMAATGAWAQGYTVTLKDGTEDAENWTISDGTNSAKGNVGLTGLSGGETVTATYSGTKRVKSVTAVKVVVPATEYTLAEATVGMIVGTDGKAYAVADKDNLPEGVTAAGMVAYKNGLNGLVIALADEANTMNWNAANGANGAAAHTPKVTGGTWKLPSQNEWKNMFKANGDKEESYIGLHSAITAAGGKALMLAECYWSSTAAVGNKVWILYPYNNSADWYDEAKSEIYKIRACFAF